ncbi:MULTISPECIES: ferredoxin [unclassified Kitasatospora]|uniref:ferredoxin n=1 Tax=unclassified Kitasatospora TaxID=2633591 RepID=UPI0034231050
MKVIVDQHKCVASGQCVLTAPEVFDQREEDGIVVLLTETPPDHLMGDIRQAAVLCPAQAIWVAEQEKAEQEEQEGEQ